jgi:hypothetical protein
MLAEEGYRLVVSTGRLRGVEADLDVQRRRLPSTIVVENEIGRDACTGRAARGGGSHEPGR